MDKQNTNGFGISNKSGILYALIIFALYLLILKIFSYDNYSRGVANDSFQVFIYLITGVILLTGSGKLKTKFPKQAKTWFIFALSALFFTLGAILWNVLEIINKKITFPSYADIGYTIFYFFVIWGILRFPMKPLEKNEKIKLVLDLSIVIVSSLLFLIIGIYGTLVVVNKVNPDITLNFLTDVIGVEYPLLDLVLLWTLFYYFFRYDKSNQSTVIALLFFGFLFLFYSDIMLSIQIPINTYINGSYSDFGYILSFLLIGLAGIFHTNFLLNDNKNDYIGLNHLVRKYSRIFVTYSPFYWMFLSYLVILWLHNNPDFKDYTLLEGGVGIIIILATVRQFYTIFENRKLTKELEYKVFDRTKELSKANEDLKYESLVQKLLHDELLQSEEKYKSIIENSFQGVVIFQDNHIVFANNKVEEITGYTIEEIRALKFDDYINLFLLEDFLKLTDNLKKRFSDKIDPDTYQVRFKHKIGNIIWLDVYSSVLKYNGKKAIQLAFIDFTGRKKIETKLIESEEKYRLLFENEIDSILLVDAVSMKILDCNSSFLKLYGYTKEEILRLTAVDLSAEVEKTIAAIKYNLETGYVDVALRYHKKKDGTVFPIELTGGVFNWQGRKVICSIVRDISERLTLENKSKELTNELKELNKSKDKFFSIIAHDLRSPFHGLLGFADVLSQNYENLNDEERKEYIGYIKSTSQQLFNLADNLLQWTRIQTGRIDYIPKKFDISKTMNKTINILKGNLQKKNINLINEIKENTIAEADEFMIQSVLQNILSNAIKFTNPGGKIRIYDYKTDEKYLLTFEDNGVGIPSDVIPGLFKIDSHYTTHGTDNEEGTGLGLILCRELIERNGGKISVESNRDKGSKFTIELNDSIK
jgi:PAS domain S-box-containing protein